MSRLVRLVVAILLAGPVLGQDEVPAAFVTARTFLRADLSAGALAQEAFEASRLIQVDPLIRAIGGTHFEEGARALWYVAEALESEGRSEDARGVLGRAIELAEPDGVVLPNLASIYSRLHTLEETRAWLSSIPGRKRRVLAGMRLVQACLERGDDEYTRGALQSLAAMHRHGWDPSADAWLSVGWGALGDRKTAQAWAARVLEGPSSAAQDVDFSYALRVLMKPLLEQDDPAAAERLVAAYGGEEEPWGVDSDRLGIVRKYLELGEFDAARALTEKVKGRRYLALAHAEVGAALLEAKLFEEATAELQRAGEIARQEDVLARCWVVPVFMRAGLDEPANVLLGESLEMIRKQPDEQARALHASFLADAAIAANHSIVLLAAEQFLDEQMRGVLFANVIRAHARNDKLAVLASVFAQEQSEVLRYKALASILIYKENRERGDRYRTELAKVIVECARTLRRPEERALLIARVVADGYVTPEQASALHFWSLPPTLAGEWTTPEDADAHAALLYGALGELPRPQVRGIRRRTLAFHPDAELIEYDGIRNASAYHYVVVRTGKDVNLLFGERAPLDLALRGSTWRESDEALLDHVHLSIGALAGKHGRYRVAENIEVVEALRSVGSELPELTIGGTKVLERTNDGTRLEVAFFAGRRMEVVNAIVDANGRVSLEPVRLVAEDLPLDGEISIDGAFQRQRAALRTAQELRQEDEAAGAYALGLAFATGFGEGGWSTDPNLASSWFLHARAQGHPGPFQSVGLAWRDGTGVAPDANQAIEWLSTAASKGNHEAGCQAAELLQESLSPERRARGRRLLQKGAAAGHARSTQMLEASGAPSGDR